MDLDDFLEVFNTLYAVNLAGDVEGQTSTIERMVVSQKEGLGNRRVTKKPVVRFRKGRCEGSWNGDVCGGRCGDKFVRCIFELTKLLLPLVAFWMRLCGAAWQRLGV